MKLLFVSLGAVILVGVLQMAAQASKQSARDYYKELYQAGGLDRMASEYVCFKDDRQNDTFFIFSQSKTIREFLSLKTTAKDLKGWRKDFLIVRGYEKGIPWNQDMFFTKMGGVWSSEKAQTLPLGKHSSMVVIMSINEQTLRYRWSVVVVDKTERHTAVSSFGRCENVPTDVLQNAAPE